MLQNGGTDRVRSKMMRLLTRLFGLICLLTFGQSVIGEESMSGAMVMSVTGTNQHTLSSSGNQLIDMSGLRWVGVHLPWADVAGKTIVLGSEEGKPENIALNRYGDLRGKIMMEPLGWMQKYWVEKGMAIVSGAGPSPKESHRQLLVAEEGARRSKRGVWKHKKIILADDLRVLEARGGFQLVEGRVMEFKKIRGISYLNFGTDWKIDFTAAISSKNRANFKQTNWKFPDIVNKWVRVRGRVRSYNGPYMELIFPEQIEVLE